MSSLSDIHNDSAGFSKMDVVCVGLGLTCFCSSTGLTKPRPYRCCSTQRTLATRPRTGTCTTAGPPHCWRSSSDRWVPLQLAVSQVGSDRDGPPQVKALPCTQLDLMNTRCWSYLTTSEIDFYLIQLLISNRVSTDSLFTIWASVDSLQGTIQIMWDWVTNG